MWGSTWLLGSDVRKEHVADMMDELAVALNEAAAYDAGTAMKSALPPTPHLAKRVDFSLSACSARFASNCHGVSMSLIHDAAARKV